MVFLILDSKYFQTSTKSIHLMWIFCCKYLSSQLVRILLSSEHKTMHNEGFWFWEKYHVSLTKQFSSSDISVIISTKSGKCQVTQHYTFDLNSRHGHAAHSWYTTSTGPLLLFCFWFCNGCAIPELIWSQHSVTHRTWAGIHPANIKSSYQNSSNNFELAWWSKLQNNFLKEENGNANGGKEVSHYYP